MDTVKKRLGQSLLKGISTRVAIAITLVLGLSSCFVIDDIGISSHTLTVENRCQGGMFTVKVYLDGRYLGDVTDISSFGGVTRGSHTLRATGTASPFTTVSKDHFFDSSYTWVLC